MTRLPCLIRGLVVVLVALAAESVTGQGGGLVAPGAKVERVATGFGFLDVVLCVRYFLSGLCLSAWIWAD